MKTPKKVKQYIVSARVRIGNNKEAEEVSHMICARSAREAKDFIRQRYFSTVRRAYKIRNLKAILCVPNYDY